MEKVQNGSYNMMQLKKEIYNNCTFFESKYLIIALSMVLILSIFNSNQALSAFGQEQPQPQPQPQQPSAGSLVNSICQLVQSNGLISGLVGLDQALNICNNLNSIGSTQALSELCSTIGGLNVINVDSFCNQQQATNQTQSPNENNEIPNTQEGVENTQGSTESPPSNSIIDRILGLLFGFLNF